MVFSKAIQFKACVERFNHHRNFNRYANIVCDCGMFSIGQWSVTLSLSKHGVFFSSEMNSIIALLADGGITFFVGSNLNGPVLHFQ